MTAKKNDNEKFEQIECENYKKEICQHLNCSECGMNPSNKRDEVLESQYLTIKTFKEIGDNSKGILMDLIDNPFDNGNGKFLKFLDNEGGIFYVNYAKDLERITMNLKGKVIEIILLNIIKVSKGTFKSFKIKLCSNL